MIDAPAFIEEEPTRNGIREIIGLVGRRKLLIFAPAVVTAAIAWGMVSVTVPRYAATAALTLNVDRLHLVDREVVSRLPLENSTLRSEIDVIRSRSLNDEVVVQLGLAGDPGVAREVAAWQAPWSDFARRGQNALHRYFPRLVGKDPIETPAVTAAELTDWLVGNLNVGNDGRSLTIVLSFTSENPQRAAQIVNAITQTYLNDQVLAKNRATMAASNWLGERVRKIREDLEASEAAVDDFRRTSGLLEIKGATIPAERLADMNAQLSAARAERMRAEVKLQIARESGPETLPDDLASPMLKEFRQALREINLHITDLQDHGAYYKQKDLEARAAVLRTQMTAEMSHITGSLSSEVAAASRKEGEIEQSFRKMESQLGDAAHSGVRLMQLQREADANRSIYETFLSRYKQAMEQESLSVPDARLISRAEPPEEPVYPNKLRSLLLGIVGGLAIGGGLAFLARKLRPADPPNLGGRDDHRHPGLRVPAQSVAVARPATAGLSVGGPAFPVLRGSVAHPYRAARSRNPWTASR